jgi:hypothetical protein
VSQSMQRLYGGAQKCYVDFIMYDADCDRAAVIDMYRGTSVASATMLALCSENPEMNKGAKVSFQLIRRTLPLNCVITRSKKQKY